MVDFVRVVSIAWNETTDKTLARDACSLRYSLDYLRGCHFSTVQIFRESIIHEYDFICKIDCDATILNWSLDLVGMIGSVDLFGMMKKRNASFAFHTSCKDWSVSFSCCIYK